MAIPHGDFLSKLVEKRDWTALASLTEKWDATEARQPSLWFFRSMALKGLGRHEEAVDLAAKGLELDPASEWGNKVYFDALLASERIAEAFQRYKTFIESYPDTEGAKAWYVERAAERGLLELASEVNETRSVVKDVPEHPRLALAVQCFIKTDTLTEVFSRLLQVENTHDVALVILQDSATGSRSEDSYGPKREEVGRLIGQWTPTLAKKYFSLEFLENRRNLGTAPTCRRLLDFVASRYDGFLFLEDDCLLSPSALDWTKYHLQHSIKPEGPWFCSCESIFFDRQHGKLDAALVPRLQRLARNKQLCDSYVLLDFVPSTCFATLSPLWRKCASARSFTRGPESLSRLMRQFGHRTLAPVVPRAVDIGMLHELGYSRTTSGATNVREVKNTYIEFEGQFDSEVCIPYPGDGNLLFAATSNLLVSEIEKLERIILESSPSAENIA